MTVHIPDWLLYLLYAAGGIAVLAVVFVVAAFAFVGWCFLSVWRPPNW